MNNSEYATYALSNFVSRNSGEDGLVHAAMGLAGEAGECLDLIKKVWAYGKPLDQEKLKLELGDTLWYLVNLCTLNGWTLEDIMEANKIKLDKRYPKGYTSAAAIAQADMQATA